MSLPFGIALSAAWDIAVAGAAGAQKAGWRIQFKEVEMETDLMSLSHIELSNYSEAKDQYLEGPYFDTDLWPLVLKDIEAIERVFIFGHKSSKVPTTTLNYGLIISPNIRDIGPMNQLSFEAMATLAVWSFAGHLSVLFQVSDKSRVLRKLVNLYPSPGKLYLNGGDELGLTDEARLELEAFLNAVSEDYVVMAFAHDADPSFIFGHEARLCSLVDNTARAWVE